MPSFIAITFALAATILASAAFDRVMGAGERASVVGTCVGVIVFAVIVSPAAIHDFLAWKRWKRSNDA